ncbi:nucleotidyltransferase family protein [Streptomyces sp. URMC 123]|uniref:nucleotidyltransferase family protein n=1 Tax=Streptomyces sp. URMC 123 TaxID=3423403 RepID=UPI003F1C3B00
MSSPSSPGEALTPEANLLLALARPRLTGDEAEVCRDLMSRDINWGRFIDLCGRNKMLPLVGCHLSTHRLFHGRDGSLVVPYHYLHTSVHLANRVRNQALMEEFGRVLDAIEAEGTIRYAVRKGPVIIEDVYPDLGARRMTDLDLLVHAEDKEALREKLLAAGYVQGRVSRDGESVEPFSRRTRMFWRMHLNNELPYVRLARREDLTAFTIDVCLDILPPGEERGRHTPEILDRARPDRFCGLAGRRLAYEDHVVDLAVHLFKEATTLYYIENQADLQLQKFVDVLGTLPAAEETETWAGLVRRAEELGVTAPVYFTLSYTEVLFPRTVPGPVLDALRPDDVGYLDEYGAADGAPARWSRPFVQRLLEADTRREPAARSGVPRT